MKRPILTLHPDENELPSKFSERLGVLYSSSTTSTHKKNSGQFFTPVSIGHFMSKDQKTELNSINILDPGAGTSILSCCLIENLIKNSTKLNSIRLTCYETDLDLIPYLERSLSYLSSWCNKKNTNLFFTIILKDFITENYKYLYNFNLELYYDFIITNPPYFKINNKDPRVRITSIINSGQPNIYASFLAISSKMLNKNGTIISINPRSFTSGKYFEAFRNFYFNNIKINSIHIFSSRSETFSKDSVLQETIIVIAQNKNDKENKYEITISSSNGLQDLETPNIETHKINEIVDFNTTEKIIHLPISNSDKSIIDIFKSWSGTLMEYGLSISTGPVVAYRCANDIIESTSNKCDEVPLYWLHNINKMKIEHPLSLKGKGQFIRIGNQGKRVLIPNKNYVFIRRFSSKEEESRLNAAPYIANSIEYSLIGVENKLNYIYRIDGYLSRFEVVGLSALLNSKLFDLYFRTFNGNINVSATELRAMPLPPLEDIKNIGSKIILSNDFSIENSSNIVSNYFKFKQ